MLESKQNLYDTGLFNSVDIEPESLEVDRRLVNLAISVRERKTGYLETGLGVGNIHGNRISAEWGHRNLFGRGYALNARTSFAFSIFPGNEFNLKKLDYREKFVSHEGELRIPHVLSTWNTLTFGAYYEKDATVEGLNAAFQAAADGPMKGILGVETHKLVSMDFKGDPRSSIVDAQYVQVMGGNMVKVVSWYDNEWGYSKRCVDLIRLMAS